MWTKQSINDLKDAARAFLSEENIREHITALNVHLNRFESQPLIHKKIEHWKEAETEADWLKTMLGGLRA
jgi:hypothetical protein